MLPLELTRPAFLLLLIPACVLLGWYFVKSLTDFTRGQRIGSLVVRVLIVLCIVLSLSGLYWLHPTDKLFVVFAVDQSDSLSDEAHQAAKRFVDDAMSHPNASSHQAAWMPFGRFPGQIRSVNDGLDNDGLDSVQSGSDAVAIEGSALEGESHRGEGDLRGMAGATDIAAAIEASAGFIPPGFVPRIVLLSDGNETVGDSAKAASLSKTPVYTYALPTRKDPEVQVAEVLVPAEVQEGEPFFVDVAIQSTHEDEGLVEVYRGDHKVVSEKKKLVAGKNSFRFQQSIDRDRLAAFTVRVSGLQQDTLLDNNTESGLVFASGKPRVLIVESDPNLIRELAYALEDEGIQVDVRPSQGMPETLADLQNYECLILSNVPATDLTTEQMQVAKTYVQDLGGGFIMLGGEQSFGLGGYYKSPLEDILPVRSDFEKEKETPSLGMVLVIDKSGSMSGDAMEMAKSAAQGAVDLLGRRDYVGVLAFDGDTYVVSEMQQASNASRINSDISRIEASGGTNMFPAMEMANDMLMATPAKLKHAILLTDGQSNHGDFEGLAQQMASAKMTVSTVAVGDGADATLMENIARSGRGRFYHTVDPSQVPQIFAKETVAASKSAIDEQPFIPQTIRATHALKEIDMENAPFLLGYVMTRPKPTSEVILATERGDPLLAWWRYGLGMTTAFTSDAKSRWGAEWMTWPGYGKFWTQVVRQTMRKNDTKGIQMSVVRSNNRAQVLLDAVSEVGFFLNDAQVELTVIQPGMKHASIPLQQIAPGRYEGDFDSNAAGAYHLEVTVKEKNGSNGGTGGEEKVLYRQSRGMMVGYSDELRIRPTNTELLSAISTLSHGKSVELPEEAFAVHDERSTRPSPLWPWLLGLAALLWVADVALRRVDLSVHYPFS